MNLKYGARISFPPTRISQQQQGGAEIPIAIALGNARSAPPYCQQQTVDMIASQPRSAHNHDHMVTNSFFTNYFCKFTKYLS